MHIQLDQGSRVTIGRFGLKLCVALFIGTMGKTGYVVTTAAWLSIYSICAAVFAMIAGERFPTKSFNHWDEALWFVALSLGLRLLHKVLT
jgi:hypothetical protein